MGKFAETHVRKQHGVPTLFVDGQPLHGMTATSVAFGDPGVIRDFVASGCEIMMIWIEAGLHCWKGPGHYDWTYAEQKLSLFEEHSGESKWIIRVRLGIVDGWFKHAYPSEVHNPPGSEDQGRHSTCNIVSPIWRKHLGDMLAAFIAWLKGTRWAPRIIGFMLNAGATEEWLIFDAAETTRGKYHAVYTREFRNWLRVRYRDNVETLRIAWHGGGRSANDDNGLTFETAACPTGHVRKGSHIWGPYSLRDIKEDQAAVDYYRFLNESLADGLIGYCRIVKEAAGSPIICGGFHSYLWWETGVYSYIQEYGHGLIQRLNQSPWIDFVSDITSYDCRYPGGPSNYLGLPQSLSLHNKLHYTEVDLVTVSSLPAKWRQAWAKADTSTLPARVSEPVIPHRVWNWDNNYCGRDEAEQIALFQREHLHNLITGSPYWWFDIRKDNYREPWMIEALRKLSDIGKQAVEWDRRSIAEVAFICSEDTPMHQAAMNGELLRFELESNHALLLDLCTRKWGLAGVPFDIYELHDLAHPEFPGEQYKLIIFANCAAVSPKAAEGVRRWQNDQRTLCWTYAPAVLHERGIDPASGQSVVGTRIGWRNSRENIRVQITDTQHPLTSGGAALSFGTEGSVGPVFFADDPQALVLGRLRDGDRPAFTLVDHGAWRSVYLAMLNFGPALLRNLARFAGAHVWVESDDVLYSNRSLLCLHTASGGAKRIKLPAPAMITDLWTGEQSAGAVREIAIDTQAFRTRFWRAQYSR
jgi:hypothetical protein